MREKVVAANWKMYKNPQEVRSFCDELPRVLPVHLERHIHIYPQAVVLETLKTTLSSHHIRVGAQNCHFEDEGAFTGEISPKTLKDLNCFGAIVGHSERRQLFHETNELCSKKIQALQKHNLVPMYCIGETAEERKSNNTLEVLKKQLTEGLKLCDFSKRFIIAYEPVWAIGTGEVATPEQAQEAHAFIRSELSKLGVKEATILYGGSVKSENAKELISQADIDGFLVGGASLKAQSFAEICKIGLAGINATQNTEKKMEI